MNQVDDAAANYHSTNAHNKLTARVRLVHTGWPAVLQASAGLTHASGS